MGRKKQVVKPLETIWEVPDAGEIGVNSRGKSGRVASGDRSPEAPTDPDLPN